MLIAYTCYISNTVLFVLSVTKSVVPHLNVTFKHDPKRLSLTQSILAASCIVHGRCFNLFYLFIQFIRTQVLSEYIYICMYI